MSRKASSRGDRGKAPFTLRPMRMLLLMIRLLWLVSRRLKFCKAILTAGVMTLGSPARSLWRPDLRGGVQSRHLVSPLSLQGERPLKERHQLRITFLT